METIRKEKNLITLLNDARILPESICSSVNSYKKQKTKLEKDSAKPARIMTRMQNTPSSIQAKPMRIMGW